MKLSILGSTGSIGTQALDVVRKQNYEVETLCANSSVNLLENQIREFKPKLAVLANEEKAKELKIKVGDTNTKILGGFEGVLECATYSTSDIVLNSLVGMIGLVPTINAIKVGKTIALANKETLVAGGDLVMKLAKEKGVSILPVDSEHSAIFQCLQAKNPNSSLKRILLTASGGPFFGKTRKELESVIPADALKHPNWDMGAKITIDSASLMNKGLEVIEAVHLFGVDVDEIEVVVHRESIIHSMVEFVDNSVIAQLGVPDMRIPIQYALTYPNRFESPTKQLDFKDITKMTFYQPDTNAFGCLDICKQAIKIGGLVPCAVNAANEEAVKAFLNGKINFLQIEDLARNALQNQKKINYSTLEEVLECEKTARENVLSQIK